MRPLELKLLSFKPENLDKLESIPEKLEQLFLDLIVKTTNDIKYLSQSYVPVDQGVARASHYTVFGEGGSETDNMAEGISEAIEESKNESRWGHKNRNIENLFFGTPLDSGDASRVASNPDLIWGFVCVAVVYGLELEFGFVSGSLNMRDPHPNASRPFLTRAVLEYEDTFFAACRAAMGKI